MCHSQRHVEISTRSYAIFLVFLVTFFSKKRNILISYTTSHYLVFRYYSNSETYLCETLKSIVLWWISPEEKEKLLAFENKKKEKYPGLKAYDGTTMEGI